MKTYFFTNNINSYIKIGKSLSPRSRALRVAGECPFVKIKILHVIEGDYEKRFHRLYSENRVCGEWYDIPGLTVDVILADLESMKSECPTM